MVPTDIVDHILSLLRSDEDYTTLKTCSIVFPQFTDRHLYSQITLDIVDGGLVSILPFKNYHYHKIERTYYILQPTNFLRLLIDRPHIANYVRVVQIIIKLEKNTFDLTSKMLELITRQLRDRISVTSSILSILPYPESIMVKVRGQRLSWHRLGPEFSTTFRNCIRLPSIKSVTIDNMADISLDHFDDCKSLKHLHLDGRFLHAEIVSISPYPHLSSVHMNSHHNLTRAVSWMKSNTLHTLSLRLHTATSLSDFHILLEACSTTLVDLDINLNNNYGPVSTSFPDLQLPSLEHLTIRSPLEAGPWDISPLSLLVRFSASIKSISSLSPVRLTLHLLVFRLGSEDGELDWSLVIPVLSLPVFRHPIELHLTNGLVCMDMDHMDRLLEQNSDMKRLLEDGKLAVFLNEEWS